MKLTFQNIPSKAQFLLDIWYMEYFVHYFFDFLFNWHIHTDTCFYTKCYSIKFPARNGWYIWYDILTNDFKGCHRTLLYGLNFRTFICTQKICVNLYCFLDYFWLLCMMQFDSYMRHNISCIINYVKTKMVSENDKFETYIKVCCHALWLNINCPTGRKGLTMLTVMHYASCTMHHASCKIFCFYISKKHPALCIKLQISNKFSI